MNTSNNLEQQCAQAMQRINEGINRSAGQHKRRVRAGQPLPPEPISSPSSQDHAEHDLDTPTGWELLAWGVVALAATACAVILAFAIGFYA